MANGHGALEILHANSPKIMDNEDFSWSFRGPWPWHNGNKFELRALSMFWNPWRVLQNVGIEVLRIMAAAMAGAA